MEGKAYIWPETYSTQMLAQALFHIPANSMSEQTSEGLVNLFIKGKWRSQLSPEAWRYIRIEKKIE